MLALDSATAVAIFVPIAVAFIGGPFVWLLRRWDSQSAAATERNHEVLVEIRDSVKNTNSRLDDHLNWHSHYGWSKSS